MCSAHTATVTFVPVTFIVSVSGLIFVHLENNIKKEINMTHNPIFQS